MSALTHADLTNKKCVPCEGGVPALSRQEAERLVKAVVGWKLADDAKSIRRKWTARNFMAGIHFFEKVAALAEDEGHHPDLHLEGYRNVAIDLTTHAVGGLTINDFVLAAKINELPIEVKHA